MNKRIVTITLVLFLPLTVLAFPGGKGCNRKENHHGDRVEHMAKQLDLNANQKNKLEVIFNEKHKRHEAMRREIRLRIQKVLSSEQMARLDKMKNDRHEKCQNEMK